MTSEEERRQNGRGMTWHSLSRVLARCKSQTNLPWQLQPSQWKPTGISNSPTRRTKPRGNQNFKEHNDNSEKKKNKNTDGVPVNNLILTVFQSLFLDNLLHFTLCPVPVEARRGGKKKKKHLKGENEKQKRGLSKGVKRPKSQYSPVWGRLRAVGFQQFHKFAACAPLLNSNLINWTPSLLCADLRMETNWLAASDNVGWCISTHDKL